MMQQEFEKMMGISDMGMHLILNDEVYKVIEEMYMESEDENKEQFCSRVKENQLIHKAADGIISGKNAEIADLRQRVGMAENMRHQAVQLMEQAERTAERQDQTIQQLQDELDMQRKLLERANEELKAAADREIKLKAKLYDCMIQE